MEKFENVNELIIALLLWITSNTDYINPKQVPDVKFLEQNELSQLACKKDCEILAYTPVEPKYTVYLSKKYGATKTGWRDWMTNQSASKNALSSIWKDIGPNIKNNNPFI